MLRQTPLLGEWKEDRSNPSSLFLLDQADEKQTKKSVRNFLAMILFKTEKIQRQQYIFQSKLLWQKKLHK